MMETGGQDNNHPVEHEDARTAADEAAGHTAVHVSRLELTRPSMWSRGMRVIALAMAAAIAWYFKPLIQLLSDPQMPLRMLFMVALPPLAFLLWVLWRWWDTPRTPRAIEFGDTHVVLPLSPHTRRSLRLEYAQIQGIFGLSRGESHALLIDTGRETLGYEDADFSADLAPGATELLAAELHQRINQLPDRTQIWARLNARQKMSYISTSKPAPVTRAMLVILAVYFGIELWTGALDDPLGLIQLGANAPALIAQGQYWRLISANFLHGGWIHLLFNAMALYFLGLAVEKLMGSWRMLLIYLTSAIAGSVGSWLLGLGALSVGSSTAIFGLFGAFLALHLRYGAQLTPPFRQSRRWWLTIVGVNVGLTILVPAIDYGAHAAGMLSGFALALLMLHGADQLRPDLAAPPWVRVLAGGVSALSAAGLIFAGIYAFQSHTADEETVFASMLADARAGDAGPEVVNEIAWMAATNPRAARWQLAQAREALRTLVDAGPARVELRDTLATLEYRIARMSAGDNRLKALHRAIALQVTVLRDARAPDHLGVDEQIFASQLARFLDYQYQIDGTRLPPDLAPGWKMPLAITATQGRLQVDAPKDLAGDVEIYASVVRGNDLAGLLEICLPAGHDPGAFFHVEGAKKPERFDASQGVKVRPALLDDQADCGESRAPHARFWPMDSEISRLP